MKAKALIIPVIILCVAAALLFVIRGHWSSLTGAGKEQRTDDAYVRADLTPLSTRISATVKKLNVNDYEAVKPGQLLVQLDDADYRAILEQARAGLAASEAQLEDNQAAKRIQDAQIQTAQASIRQAEAAVDAAKAGVDASQADVVRTQAERNRQEALLTSKATTQQFLEQAVADSGRYTGALTSHKADVARAEAALASSQSMLETANRQRAALDTKDNVFRADIQAKKAAIIVAEVNLGYTKILAPAEGAVGERHVQEGQLVSPGMQLIDVVNGDVWIQANYKETQLANVRRGDPADIRIDTFPGVVLHGKVAEIAPASGSQFALLPPDNATGNFTKVVQRVPVKIVLDPGHPLQGRMRPGFSAVVTIHGSGRRNESASAQS